MSSHLLHWVYIPMEFHKSRVVFIPKPLKNDCGEAGSFRPISLTQFLFKTMERVVEWSLREHSNNYGKISEMQHAYSGTKGTDTALSTLVNMIESSILRSEYCLVLSIDIIGAFDNLATTTIHYVMVENNYPPTMIRWYMNRGRRIGPLRVLLLRSLVNSDLLRVSFIYKLQENGSTTKPTSKNSKLILTD